MHSVRTYLVAACLLIMSGAVPGPCGATDILNIRHWAASDHTRIVIDTSDDAQFSVTKGDQKISILFRSSSLTEGMPPAKKIDEPGISEIKISTPGEDQILVELFLTGRAEANIFKLAEFQDKPFRVVIDLTIPELEKKESAERQRFKISKKDKIIVIDPGHGGEDPGAIGPKRTMEKDVVLKIARRLQHHLNKKPGYRAFLTRTGDYYPSFRKRLKIATDYGPDLFISIHADACRDRRARGTSVYCLSTKRASSEAARLLANQENLADIIGGSEGEPANGESDPITLHMIQTETINLSKVFGNIVLKKMRTINPVKAQRVQEAPFMVLKTPHVPSVLIETAYISNPKEEALLRDSRFREKMAVAIMGAIQEYLRDPEPDSDLIHIVQEEEREEARAAGLELPRQEVVSRPPPRLVHYKVRKRDTLPKIARAHGTSVDALVRLNKLKRKDRPPAPGTKLKIYVAEQNGRTEAEDSARRAPSIHVVKKGESLGGIAARYRITVKQLAEANRLRPGKPLFIGVKLKIPRTERASGAAARAAASSPKKRPGEKFVVYTVKKGDSLKLIARRHKTTVAEIAKINKLKLNAPLYVNKKLKIPIR
ncbi:MAG TPA: N-acetylmuramoyl-L-alanine amidase [Syntrophales bacterium]|nr:N-acetylmuramoyl-L-alanine amidase [Syntrophales bacterium]